MAAVKSGTDKTLREGRALYSCQPVLGFQSLPFNSMM